MPSIDILFAPAIQQPAAAIGWARPFFCKNSGHAEYISERFNASYQYYKARLHRRLCSRPTICTDLKRYRKHRHLLLAFFRHPAIPITTILLNAPCAGLSFIAKSPMAFGLSAALRLMPLRPLFLTPLSCVVRLFLMLCLPFSARPLYHSSPPIAMSNYHAAILAHLTLIPGQRYDFTVHENGPQKQSPRPI